ncbi:MAG: S41 family peptidase [Lentisphaerota bacterium]
MKILLLICLLSAAAAGAEVYKPDSSSASFSKRAVTVLDEVWANIKKSHISADFEKDYRERIYNKYLPEINKAGNDTQLAGILNSMVKEFGQSHILVLPPVNELEIMALRAAEKNAEPASLNTQDVPADTGIMPCIAEGRLCVLRTAAGSPADAAGIKAGDYIISINGLKLDPSAKSYIPWDTLASFMLAGMPESKVPLVIVNRNGIEKEYKLTRKPNGFNWFQFGAIPRTYGAFYAELLPGNIGYVHFTAFFPEQITSFVKAITGKLKDARGLIIDMRNNVGGIVILPQWLAGWSCPTAIKMGKLQLKETTLTPSSYPQQQCFKGPVAILINEGSASAAEIFAASMQDSKTAILFGSTTSGKCLPSQFLKLPSGFRLQTIFGDYERENGKHIEHIGVTPDVPVVLKLSDLRSNTDTVREAAAKYLLQKLDEKK